MFRVVLISLAVISLADSAAAFDTKPASKPVAASPSGPAITPDAIADRYFKGLQDGDVEGASREALGGLFAAKAAEAQNMVAQTTIALKMYGKIRGWEMMRERQLSPSLVERYYMLKANTPLFYRLLFYKVDGGWIVYQINFNDQFDKIVPAMPGT